MKKYLSIVIIILMISSLIPSYAMETVKDDITGHWAEETIKKWKENQLMKGYKDGSFRPNDNITKAEVITLINRIYGYYEKADKNYTDIKKQDWYYDVVSIAKANKYMEWHKEKELKPNEKITRQEICAIIAEIQQLQATEGLKKVNNFSDKDKISQWSKLYIDAVLNSGYMDGYPDNTIKAKGKITRAEVVTMLNRVVGKLINNNGTYGTDDKEQIIEGNLTINAQDVTLKNTKIKGNLILAAGIKEGEVDLVNVTVEGKTIINGGGENSITISGSQLGEVIVYKKGGKIRVVSKESVIKKFDLETSGKLEGDFKDTIITLLGADEIVDIDREVDLDGDFGEIVVESQMQIKISGEESIKKITVGAGARGTSIDIEKGSSVREIEFNVKTKVKGKGKIKKAVVKADGVTIEQKVEKKQVASGVDGSGVKESNTPSSGGNSGSNGSSGGYTRPKSSQKSIITTTIGTLENGNVINVPEGTKVQDLKSALTVSQYASVEILIISGGTIVDNQATTDVTETMVIQVTAENKTKAEYNIKINKAPTAVDDTASVNEDISVSIDVLANDSDIEGDSISIKSCTSGTNGSTVINSGNNTITYKPNTNFNGTDSFTYEVEDEHGATNTATVTVTVSPVNDAPTTVDDTVSVIEDTSLSIDVLENDSDIEGDGISISSCTGGTNGSTVINPDNTITYTPSANFSGTDSFTYEVEDIHGATSTATVTVIISPVNDAPIAVDDTVSVNENSSLSIDVLENDSDIDEDGISISSCTDGANGLAVINTGNKKITYTPNTDFYGTDSFEYAINDGNGETATAIVNVTVIQVKSTEKEIKGTTIGTLDNGNIKDVPYGTKVSDFKAGLTVSKDASVEILASSKGGSVANQENTYVSAAMVIEVTAENRTKEEYTISTPFPDNYVMRWGLNESNNDEKENYNLTGTNLPSYRKDSKEGSHSCYFDGNSELYTTNNYKFPNNAFTISTWVKFDAGMNNTDTIIDYDEIKISLYYYTLDNGNTHEIRGSINEDDGVVAADQNISQDEWHHVTFVWDGEKLKLYINSSLSDERDYTYDITVGNGSWYIGGWNGVDYNWKGHIDDVIIYDRALTNEEIIGIYYSY